MPGQAEAEAEADHYGATNTELRSGWH